MWWLAGLLTAFAAAIVAPLLVFIWPSGGKIKNATVKVSLQTPLNQLKDGAATKFQAPANYGFRMIGGGGDNYPGKVSFGGYLVMTGGQISVLSLTCSHLGCSINFEAGQFTCPCHGSHFSISGDVTHGPAQAPLSTYSWKKVSNNQIQVEGYSLQGVG
ncbi:MAG: Rieske 2Fe-2S domain-containing protein [bacterium]|nr:Rieske 2Fe-2S domain-containing protein [bacterium]